MHPGKCLSRGRGGGLWWPAGFFFICYSHIKYQLLNKAKIYVTSINKISKSFTFILSNLNNFHFREFVDRVSETQLQQGGNGLKLSRLHDFVTVTMPPITLPPPPCRIPDMEKAEACFCCYFEHVYVTTVFIRPTSEIRYIQFSIPPRFERLSISKCHLTGDILLRGRIKRQVVTCAMIVYLEFFIRKVILYLNVHPLEVVSRYRDPQRPVGGNF